MQGAAEYDSSYASVTPGILVGCATHLTHRADAYNSGGKAR